MSRSQFATLGIVGLTLFNVSCSHTSGAGAAAHSTGQNAQTTQLAQQPAHVPRSDGSASSEQLDALMKQHFATVLWARNSVIDGALEPIREPLRALSDYGYETLPLA